MTRSRIVKARAAANARRIGTTLNGKGRKFAQALKRVNNNDGSKPYMVMVDSQGVGYLRVASNHFLVNTGSKIELVEMDSATVRSRALKAVPEASILDAAKVLAQPLTSGVIISARSKKYLDLILNDKELQMAKKTTASKKAATKKSAAVANGGRVSPTVKFKKMAEEKDLPPQALGILKAVQKKGETTVSELVSSLKLESSQPMSALWSFYRARLIKGGYIQVAA